MSNHLINIKGFILVPVILMLFISMIIILAGSRELHQAVLMHQLKLYNDCHYLEKQLNIMPNKSFCPPCPKVIDCL